jgi:surfactin synthase thioesterase subunit
MTVLDPTWFATADDGAAAAVRICCFPHAGGNPAMFTDWQAALGTAAQVVGVCPPGRAWREDEPAPRDLGELADLAAQAIRAAPALPTILFGHSMGAVTAFEVARRLADAPWLRHLVASGAAAPRRMPTERVVSTSRLNGQDFADAVAFFGGLPAEIVTDEDLQALLLPDLLADFRLAAGYEYRPAPRLRIGLSLLNGRDDPHVRPELLTDWSTETVTPPTTHWTDGGHFYFQERPATVTDLLAELSNTELSNTEPSGTAAELIRP